MLMLILSCWLAPQQFVLPEPYHFYEDIPPGVIAPELNELDYFGYPDAQAASEAIKCSLCFQKWIEFEISNFKLLDQPRYVKFYSDVKKYEVSPLREVWINLKDARNAARSIRQRRLALYKLKTNLGMSYGQPMPPPIPIWRIKEER